MMSLKFEERPFHSLEGHVVAVQRQLLEGHERFLKLRINPKPSWMPEKAWRQIIKLVLVQEVWPWQPKGEREEE